MNSVTTEKFRDTYAKLPEHIQERARKAYTMWKKDLNHPALQFKQIHSTKPIYSIRITLSYRAIGIKENNKIIWFWIGPIVTIIS
jgi:mRNA-degrading endonuclease RelE of RelBE toxin-antitoxin system